MAVGQEDDCATGCLLEYPYYKENFQINVIYF